MKHSTIKTKDGFTLVELIASLVLAGILAISLTTIIITAIDGFFVSKDAAEVSQKAQLTLARIRTELLNITDISTANVDTIIFGNTYGTYKIELSSSGLITIEKTGTGPIGEKPLTNRIETAFYGGGNKLFSYEKAGSSPWTVSDDISELFTITITLKFSDNNTVFKTTINLRMNSLRNAPKLVYNQMFGSLNKQS